MPEGLRRFGRFVWKLLVVLLLTLVAMVVVGLLARVVLGLDSEDVRS